MECVRRIKISLDRSKQFPQAFLWQGRVHHVSAIQECWRTIGAWWDGEGEKTLFRVITENGGIFELSYDHMKHLWALERIED